MVIRPALFTLAVICAADVALAADLPTLKAPPPLAPSFSWTGFYAGLNAGGYWGASPTQFTAVDPNLAGLGYALWSGGLPATGAAGPSGFLGGGQFGYNYQWGDFVLGLEAQIAGATGGSSTSSINAQNLGALVVFQENAAQELNWIGTVLGRVGYVAWNRVLLYGAGGFAYGHAQSSFTVNVPPPAFPPIFGSASAGVSTGWAAGGGVEYAVTDNISARLEYLYYDLGVSNATVFYFYPSVDPTVIDSGSSLTASTRHNGNIVRAGLNYKFDFGSIAPIAAKF